jgi:branched-chain amino acid aminotransferase
VDNRKVGEGRPGPVTQELQKAFFDIIKGKDKKYSRWLTYV